MLGQRQRPENSCITANKPYGRTMTEDDALTELAQLNWRNVADR